MTDVRKLTILLSGYEIIRRSACVHGEDAHIVLAVPICCYLLETAHGLVMFDTGLNSRHLANPAEAHRLFHNDKFPAAPVVLPEHEPLSQLAGLGVAPEDVAIVILSHAHGDHTGHVAAFPNAAIVIQRREHEAAFSEQGRAYRSFADIASPDLAWRIVDGDVTLMPGLDLVLTPGHSAGHQSAVVTLPSGAMKILVGDVADLLENFDREVISGAIDPETALASIRRIKAIARETGAELIPLHDPGFVHSARLAPLWYD